MKHLTYPLTMILRLFILLPILYTLLYLSTNNQLPANDAANYFSTAINIHHYFQDQGFLRGLFHFYTERGWRPIFFPNLSVPFLLISQGNLFVAYWSTAMLCLFASMVTVYLFSRLMLDRMSAILVTSLIGLLPFVQAQILMFYSEGALFPCIIGGMYCLIQSDYLRKAKQSIGFVVLISLAIMIRPVEAVTHLAFIAMVFLFMGYSQKIFTANEILRVIFIALLAAFLFFAVASFPYLHGPLPSVMDDGGVLDRKLAYILHAALLGSALAVMITASLPGLIYQRSKLRAQHYLVPAFGMITVFVLIWFLPFSSATFQWIYRTSLGDVALSTGSLSGAQFSWDVLRIYLMDEGLLAISVIGLTALMACFMIKAESRRRILFSIPIMYLFLLAPFQIWEAFYTVQVVSRKLSLAFPALLLALLMIGLQQGKWYRFRQGLIAILLITQFSLLCMLLYMKDYEPKKPIINFSIGYFLPQSSTIDPNPHQVVIDFLNEQSRIFSIHSIGLEVMTGSPDARHPSEAAPINPFLLGMMLSASRSPYYANYLYFGNFSDDKLRNIQQQYDAVFLSDRVENMNISSAAAADYWQKYSSESNPSFKVFYQLLYHYSLNQLDTLGFKQGPCIVVKTQKQGSYRGCLLLTSR
jgi:hypothetical protein